MENINKLKKNVFLKILIFTKLPINPIRETRVLKLVLKPFKLFQIGKHGNLNNLSQEKYSVLNRHSSFFNIDCGVSPAFQGFLMNPIRQMTKELGSIENICFFNIPLQ